MVLVVIATIADPVSSNVFSVMTKVACNRSLETLSSLHACALCFVCLPRQKTKSLRHRQETLTGVLG